MRYVATLGSMALCLACQSAVDPADGGATGSSGTSSDATSSSGPGESSTGSASTTSTSSESSSSGATAETSTGDVVVPQCCAVAERPTSGLVGTTPLGAVPVGWGWYGSYVGECAGHAISILASPEDLDDWSSDDAVLGIYVATGATGPATGTISVAVDGQEASLVDIELVVDALSPYPEPNGCGDERPIDPADEMTITIDLETEGWDVEGTITVPYCPTLNVACP